MGVPSSYRRFSSSYHKTVESYLKPGHLTPGQAIFPAPTLSLACSVLGPTVFNSSWLQAGAGDSPPGGESLGGHLKFLWWPAARVRRAPSAPAAPGLPASGGEEGAPARGGGLAQTPGHWRLSLWRVARRHLKNVCISRGPSRKQAATLSGTIGGGGGEGLLTQVWAGCRSHERQCRSRGWQ